MSKEFLRRLPLFAELAEDDLDRLYKMAVLTTVECGEVLIEEGALGESLYVILEGEFEVTKRSGKQDVVLSVRKPDAPGKLPIPEFLNTFGSALRTWRESRRHSPSRMASSAGASSPGRCPRASPCRPRSGRL